MEAPFPPFQALPQISGPAGAVPHAALAEPQDRRPNINPQTRPSLLNSTPSFAPNVLTTGALIPLFKFSEPLLSRYSAIKMGLHGLLALS